MSRDNRVVYTGIADSLGLESFIPLGEKINYFVMEMRCRMNPGRMALMYRVVLEKEDTDEINKLFKENKYRRALCIVQTRALSVEVNRGAQDLWRRIPCMDRDEYERARAIARFEVEPKETEDFQLQLFDETIDSK